MRPDYLSAASATLRVVNDVASRLDRFAQAAASDVPAPLFVVGLPRSGTTLVYALLIQAFEVAFLTRMYTYTYGLPNLTTRLVSRFTRSPSATFESDYGRIPGRFSPAENSVLWLKWFPERPQFGHYVPPDMIDCDGANSARNTIASMTKIAGRQFVFKNVYSTLSLAALLHVFDKGRAVVMERCFDEVAVSVFRARRKMAQRSWWSIRPPYTEEVIDKDLATQVAFQCVRSQQLLKKQLQQIDPARYKIVRYSDLCESPLQVLSDIGDWIGPSFAPRSNREIPESFEKRKFTTFPPEIEACLADSAAAYRNDECEYLSRVDKRMTSHLVPDV